MEIRGKINNPSDINLTLELDLTGMECIELHSVLQAGAVYMYGKAEAIPEDCLARRVVRQLAQIQSEMFRI